MNPDRTTTLEVQINEASEKLKLEGFASRGWKSGMWLPVLFAHKDGVNVELPTETDSNPNGVYLPQADIAATRRIPTFPKFQISDESAPWPLATQVT